MLMAIGLPAQDMGRLPFSILGQDQGLPAGAVICLTQDSSGFIWLGTENGLVRYDGTHYRRWTSEDGLPSNWVARLVPATDGGVWVGTLRGLAKFKDGRLERANFGGASPQAPASLLAMDLQGRLWVATSDGIFVQQKGMTFSQHRWKPTGRLFGFTTGICTGAIYLAGEAGLQAFLPDGSTRHWGKDDGLPPGGPMLVAEDRQGRIWAGAGRDLGMKEPSGKAFLSQSHRLTASLTPNSSPLADKDGSLWFPTQEGALHIRHDQMEMLNAEQGLPFRWVRSMFRDREGILWAVGPALARLQGGGRVRNFTLSKSSFGEVVWFITTDRKGSLLVATDDGAARMGPKGLETIPGTKGRRIKSLTLDRTGTLWMVNTMGPTLWLRPGQKTAEIAPLGAFGSSVNSVMEDSRGTIWLGHTRFGALRWDSLTRKLIQEVAPAATATPNLGVYGFREDHQGQLWAGSSAGLLVRHKDGRWLRFTEKEGLRPFTVRGLDFMKDGSAWVHYQEPNGLTRIRLEGDRIKILDQRNQGQGLRSNLVYAVRVDDKDQVWITTDQGLDRLEPPLHVGRYEGMTSEDCAIHALMTEGGKVWVGTSSGLVQYDDLGMDHVSEPPQAHVLQMTFGKQTLEPPFGLINPIPTDDANLGFLIATPSYQNGRDLRFQVRLLGLETTWRDADSQKIHYPGLAGGNYRFEVQAAIGGGPFGHPATLEFKVRHPWWKRWWAIGLASLTFLAGVAGFIQLRIASLARNKVELEALVAQRTQELQDRNQELSTALTNVKQLSGLLPICAHCKKIRDDQGYWNQLEQYISTHSEAGFSHGICPECIEVHFPQFGQNRPK